jgi:hypothetical protein
LGTAERRAALSDRISGLTGEENLRIDEGTQWLIVSMTSQVIEGSVQNLPQLTSAITEVLRKAVDEWRQYDVGEINFRELCLSSTTEWDRYTRSPTPDQPAMLAHEVSAIASRSKFDVLWGAINAILTSPQRQELINWYRIMGRSLTGEPLRSAHEA